jgi:hypothetical protein
MAEAVELKPRRRDLMPNAISHRKESAVLERPD